MAEAVQRSESETDEGAVRDGKAASRPTPSPAEVLGQAVWRATRTEDHRHWFLADLEWAVMLPIRLMQFRLFMAGDRPVGFLTWARVSDEMPKPLREAPMVFPLFN
ncbi:toxin-activating lysine-acyltransferase [Rhodospirillum sp. A1_3_36]|uniref:toxin-activating lysine-acyltransferase n=1 Tax=Rhodospirillum sp. A1_3_36 TaxID=3391666 RepID=UPI0039A669D6